MGGKEGGRGYLYQGIVAVLEALRRNNWDRIYIEFPTEGDKVDIALKSADTITDAIQVKSTVNSFSKGDISKWLKDIITDYPCCWRREIATIFCREYLTNFCRKSRSQQNK